VVTGPMEVRVTPHSSLSSWDGRGAEQTKAKADGERRGGGWGAQMKMSATEREKEKLTKKSERSCQPPSDEDGEAILRRETSHKEVERKKGRGEKERERHEKRTKEIHKMFLLYRHEIGCGEEREKERRREGGVASSMGK